MKLPKIIPLLLIVLSAFSMNITNPSSVSAADEITIDILPEEVLLNIDNMKPGDWAPRSVVVQNNGILDFDYFVSVRPYGDSMKLYNELLLEISDSDEILYNGKLQDFNGLAARTLESSREETLEFTVRFPEHLGNDFQGLNANFYLLFTAEGESDDQDEQSIAGAVSSGENSPHDGSPLPSTATDIFNFLLIGLILLLAGTIIYFYNRKRAL